MLNKKKALTISIEEPIQETEEEIQSNLIISAINQFKRDDSSPLTSILLPYDYQKEKKKVLINNNSYLTELLRYMEGENYLSDLSYSWVIKYNEINQLSRCLFLTQQTKDIYLQKDCALEYSLLKIITEDNLHHSHRIMIDRSFKANNRYSDLVPCMINLLINYLDAFNITPFSAISKQESGNLNEWYINASYINGPTRDDQKAFIATQGPLPNTIGKFYQMCLTHDVNLIVMICSFEEEGRKKCERYFPLEIGKADVYNFNVNNEETNIEVTLQKEDWIINDCLIKRELLINVNNQKKVIYHLQMINWADHCAPNELMGYESIQFIIQSIAEFRKLYQTSPVVIHCSAGTGRTGTIIALFNLVKCLSFYKSVAAKNSITSSLDNNDFPKPFMSVFNIVRKLREQRYGMVSSIEQYKYIYLFMLDWAKRNLNLVD